MASRAAQLEKKRPAAFGVREIGRTEQVRVSLVRDAAGRAEYPASPRVVVAVHIGTPVEMCCQRAGQVHRGRAIQGDIEIIPAQTPGVWDLRAPDAALAIGLSMELLRGLAAEYGRNPDKLAVRNRFQARDAQMEHLAWALKAEMERGFPSGRIYLDALATALGARVVREHSEFWFGAFGTREAKGRMSPRTLRKVLGYIEDHLSEDLGLADLAAVAGLSPSHFKATFRESAGSPAHRYLLRRRVERAAELLRETEMPISQVALAAGFAHQSHLALHTRRILGRSPREIRGGAA